MKPLFRLLLLAGGLFAGPFAYGQLNLQWQPREDLNILYPPSVRFFETNTPLPGGARLHALHVKVDLRDPNLKLRAVGEAIGASFSLKTVKQYAERENALLAVNGGFFSSNASLSLITTDGVQLAPNVKQINRPLGGVSTPYFPTRSAFGLVDGKPDVAWVYGLGCTGNAGGNTTYQYPNPAPVSLNAPPPPAPTPLFPAGASVWSPSQALGGGPVLVQDGQLRVTTNEELFQDIAGRNPRTAVGYPDDHTVIFLVVDGRQEGSAGVTLDELGQMMLELGAKEALNLDGGGSSTLSGLGGDYTDAGTYAHEMINLQEGNRHVVRAVASAFVLAEAAESPKKEVTILDNGTGGYAERGFWESSNQKNYFGSSAARVTAAGNGLTKATYRFAGIDPGKYQLAAWWTTDAGNATDVPYTLYRNGVAQTFNLNQADPTAAGRWHVLGEFELGPDDYLEITNAASGGTVVADAVRLVQTYKEPAVITLPKERGDLRIAVVSDLNASYGSTTYEWQVDSIFARLPRLWQPDLVVSGGDMVAGQSTALSDAQLRAMWDGFDSHVASRLRAANLPFVFTLGNHDGSGAGGFGRDRDRAAEYWRDPAHKPAMQYVDDTHYPFYYSFTFGETFFVSWDATDAAISEAELGWVRTQFSSEAAKKARKRFLVGHLPLYAVVSDKNKAGEVLNQPDKLRALMEELDVHMYISGHQHAYYPGKRGDVQLLNAGAAGSGPRRWLNLDKAPVHTVTIMDVFLERDTIIYSTYDIKEKVAGEMRLFDEKVLPKVVVGFNGFVLRHDVSTGQPAAGNLSALHALPSHPGKGTGTVSVKLGPDNQLVITGSFAGLAGKVLEDRKAVSLYRGLNGEEGTFLTALNVLSADGRNGTFSGQFPYDAELLDLLAIGGLYVSVRTDGHPAGEIRTHLYDAANQAPPAAPITTHNAGEVYPVRDLEVYYKVLWERLADADADQLTYTYQVARDPAFAQLLVHRSTGRQAEYKVTEKEWYALLGEATGDEVVTLYHRVISSDGKHLTTGPALPLRLKKNDAPLTDLVEIPAPNYVYKGRIAGGAGYGATWDGHGKLWLCNYSGALYVKNADHTFTTYTRLKFGATTVTLGTLTGISTDDRGDILLTRGATLYRIDAKTAEIAAAWTSPASLSMARVNDKGQVYAAGLLGNAAVYVLERDPADAGKYKPVRTITLPAGRLLSRTFAMTPDGKTFYFSDPGNPAIQQYVSTDGTAFTLERLITTTASGTSGLQLDAGGALYTATKGSGVLPATFGFRDERAKKTWTLPLADLGQSEARGLGCSPQGDSLIFCAWTVNPGFHLYVRQDGPVPPPAVKNIPTYRVEQVRGTDANGVADSTGVYCALEGVVQSINFSESGLSFFLGDNQRGIQVFRQAGRAGYSPRKGDKIRVVGRIGQESGSLRIAADSLRLLAAGLPPDKPVATTRLGEANEAAPVTLQHLKLTDRGQWTTGSGYLGYWVEVADSVRTYRLFIDRQTDLYSLPFPKGRFNVTGFVSQYDDEAPYLGGYEVWPGSQADIYVHPVLALNLNSACSDNPAVAKRWRVQNPNKFAVDVRWELKGTAHGGTLEAPPGESFFTTPAVSGPNTARIEWFDQSGTARTKEKTAENLVCGARTGSSAEAAAAVLFPNPVRGEAVLRLAEADGTPLTLTLTHPGSGATVWQREGVLYTRGGVALDLRRLPAGLYILTVRGAVGETQIRFYKE